MLTFFADGDQEFVRLLYRNGSQYSDHVDLQRLKRLNIPTKLDGVLPMILQAGCSVVITGNAGDGKTHLIRMLQSQIEGAEIITDASECTLQQVIDRCRQARADGRPFCMAINEGPLLDLIRAYREEDPWLEEVHHRLLHSKRYVRVDVDDAANEAGWVPQPGETVPIDLSHRSVLTPQLASDMVDKLTDEYWYKGCQGCQHRAACPVTYNRAMLQHPQVKNRVVDLLVQVGERGLRATFRDSLSTISFLIFGNRRCEELVNLERPEMGHYYWNAFEGEGPIFAELKRGLDPLQQTQPAVDEDLWRGSFPVGEFVGHPLSAVVTANLDDPAPERTEQAVLDDFTTLKRRWYFEHPDGHLRLMVDADRFFKYLQSSEPSQSRVGRLLGLINRKWNPKEAASEAHLKLWTQLSYSPRHSRNIPMVSGGGVDGMKLMLFRPVLSPELNACLERQPVSQLLLAPPDNVRYASLVIDRKLISALLLGGLTEQSEDIERRLRQFNDALARYGKRDEMVSTYQIVDPASGHSASLRVDLMGNRYDSAI